MNEDNISWGKQNKIMTTDSGNMSKSCMSSGQFAFLDGQTLVLLTPALMQIAGFDYPNGSDISTFTAPSRRLGTFPAGFGGAC